MKPSFPWCTFNRYCTIIRYSRVMLHSWNNVKLLKLFNKAKRGGKKRVIEARGRFVILLLCCRISNAAFLHFTYYKWYYSSSSEKNEVEQKWQIPNKVPHHEAKAALEIMTAFRLCPLSNYLCTRSQFRFDLLQSECNEMTTAESNFLSVLFLVVIAALLPPKNT